MFALYLSCLNKLPKSLWRVSHRLYWKILYNEITILEVRLRVLRHEAQSKLYQLSCLYLTLTRLDSIMSRIILQGNFIWILIFEYCPVVWNKYWWEILDLNLSLSNCSWICIRELQTCKRIYFEINWSFINLNYLNIKHGTVTCDLKALWSVIIACEY